jgi:hypothetical protein
MNDSEKQILEFIDSLDTFTLGRWMVGMQELSAKLSQNSRDFPNLCVVFAARELLVRYKKTTHILENAFLEIEKNNKNRS